MGYITDASGNLLGTDSHPLVVSDHGWTSNTARSLQTVTILNTASVSEVIDLADASLLGFIMPAAWTTAALNLEVSADGAAWGSAYDAYGSQVGSIATPVVSGNYAVDISALLPWRYVRFRSGTSASPINQGAARTFKVIKRVLA